MTEGYNLDSSLTIFYWLMEYVRRISLAIVVVMASTHLWLQMYNLFMLSTFIIIAAGYIDARTRRYDRYMDVFNEIKLIVIMYHLMTFTDFVPAAETQNKIGLSCSAILILGTVTNMIMLFVTPIKSLKKNCWLRNARKNARK